MTSGISMSGFEQLSARLNPTALVNKVEKAVDESLAEGKAEMRSNIETRGTGNTWSRPWGGRSGSYPGRVDSGDMLRDVDGKITTVNSHVVEGILGWEDGSPTYYGYQENGFYHVLAARDIEGMMALRDAVDGTRKDLIDRLGRIKL